MGGLGNFYKGRYFMYNFRYVTKNEAAPVKKNLTLLINEVQDLVRDCFTFQFTFIGSASRNMITCDEDSNIGFDFDVNIEVNDDNEEYSAKELRNILRDAIDRVAYKYGYDYAEDSTRVLTIKVKDTCHSRIIHSCDFCIVNNYGNNQQEYIRFNKVSQTYAWVEQGKGYYMLPEKIDFLKSNNLWSELKEHYLYKKNANKNPNKHSRTVFAEAINEMCQQNGFYD